MNLLFPEFDEVPQKQTNYDKLISKTPEQLAEWLHDIHLISHDIGLSNEWWLTWLMQNVNQTGD